MSKVHLSLKRLFTSKMRIKILDYYFRHPGDSFYIHELKRILGEIIGPLSRELVNLEKAGILISNFRGRLKYYALNRKSPIINDLRNIFLKTSRSEAGGSSSAEDDCVGKKAMVVLTEDEQTILQAIGDEGVTAADLIAITELSAAAVQSSLVMLELKGCIGKTQRGRYYREE